MSRWNVTMTVRSGTHYEQAFAEYLATAGFPHAERRVKYGPKDKGDITGTPALCWEIKSGSKLLLPEWLRETETERVNANADYGILAIKPKGIGVKRVDGWWGVVRVEPLVRLVRQAGYGEPL